MHGHVVWEAARRLGLETIPAVRIGHLNQVERRALAIALNRIGETGEWDVEALKVEFDELIELEVDVIATGFDLAEVDALLLEDDADEPDADDVPMVSESQVSQLGDLWLMGEHRLLQGDARDREVYARLVTENQGVRLALTDVPFNVPIQGHCTGQAHHREFAIARVSEHIGRRSGRQHDPGHCKFWKRNRSGKTQQAKLWMRGPIATSLLLQSKMPQYRRYRHCGSPLRSLRAALRDGRAPSCRVGGR